MKKGVNKIANRVCGTSLASLREFTQLAQLNFCNRGWSSAPGRIIGGGFRFSRKISRKYGTGVVKAIANRYHFFNSPNKDWWNWKSYRWWPKSSRRFTRLWSRCLPKARVSLSLFLSPSSNQAGNPFPFHRGIRWTKNTFISVR